MCGKVSFEEAMEETRQSVSQYVYWCTTIALHQEFGVGKKRLGIITDKLGYIKPAGVEAGEYRLPVLRAPKNRKEQQLLMTGNYAADLTWKIYASAVVEVLRFGPDRLKRLKKASIANFDQLNQWGHEDGMEVALEKLCRCAKDAIKDGTLHPIDPDDERPKTMIVEQRMVRFPKSKNAPMLKVFANPVAQFEAVMR